ncbi:MAG: ATP-dependent zinc metalloprotease FtsH [Lentisphaeria bacterium]
MFDILLNDNPEEKNNKEAHEPKDPENAHKNRAHDVKAPRPPLQTLIFWIVILFAVPLLILTFFKQSEPNPNQLSQSEFEQLLQSKDQRIKSAILIREPNAPVKAVKGKYYPSPAAVGDESNLQPYRVTVTYTDTLDKMVRNNAGTYDTKTESNFWPNILTSLLPILLLVGLIYFLFSRQMKATGRGALQFGKSRARMNSPSKETVTFDDVAGVDEAKEDVQEVVEFLRDPDKFKTVGGKIPKGALMIGPPGTGKTLLARAISGEADVPFFSISGSDFVEMFVGVGASRVRDMFEEGKRHAPCVIFIDEIDAVGRSRFSGIGGGHDEREQTLNALLSEMDGFQPNTGIIVLAATNRPDVLDPALLRPGRFDRRITVDLPDMNGRLQILEIHTQQISLAEDTELRVIAKGTPGFSGADLANLINEAALSAARHGKNEVELADLEEARDKVRWGKERRSRTLDEHERQVTAFHESGHTLISLYTDKGMPLHKVTIIPRGQSYLGATMSLPEHDRYTRSRKEMEDELTCLMGGRLAEEIIFDDVTTGAAMDLRQSTDIARKMVCEWGMSKKLGPLAYGNREEHIYLGRDITKSEDYSEETARKIDEEIAKILLKAEDRARNLLQDHRDQLEKLGNELLEKETLDAAEIRSLLNIETKESVADEEKENTEA